MHLIFLFRSHKLEFRSKSENPLKKTIFYPYFSNFRDYFLFFSRKYSRIREKYGFFNGILLLLRNSNVKFHEKKHNFSRIRDNFLQNKQNNSENLQNMFF